MVDSLALNPPYKTREIHLFVEGIRDKKRSL